VSLTANDTSGGTPLTLRTSMSFVPGRKTATSPGWALVAKSSIIQGTRQILDLTTSFETGMTVIDLQMGSGFSGATRLHLNVPSNRGMVTGSLDGQPLAPFAPGSAARPALSARIRAPLSDYVVPPPTLFALVVCAAQRAANVAARRAVACPVRIVQIPGFDSAVQRTRFPAARPAAADRNRLPSASMVHFAATRLTFAGRPAVREDLVSTASAAHRRPTSAAIPAVRHSIPAARTNVVDPMRCASRTPGRERNWDAARQVGPVVSAVENPVCCPSGQMCIDQRNSTCAPCPAGQVACQSQNANSGLPTSVCCAPGVSCCNGQCCKPAEVCCTNLRQPPLIFGCHPGTLCVQ
jgi:hypothetical protein